MNIYSTLAISGALLGLLIVAALCLSRGERAYANRLLAGCILLSTAYLLALVPLHSPGFSQLAFLRTGGLSVFLFGPALYLYVRAVTTGEFRLHPAHLAHTLPFLLILLDQLHVLTAIAGDNGTLLLSRPLPLAVLYYLQLIAYQLLSIRLLYRFHLRIAEHYSSLEGIKLRWLGTLISIALLLSALGLAFSVGRWLFDAISWPQRVWSIGMMIAINYLIAFFAMTQPVLFNPSPSEKLPSRSSPARYQTSSLTPTQAQAIWRRLEHLMATEKPYLRNELKIADLAAILEMPVNHLSQTINQIGDCSFFAYINRYRVEAARKLLQASAPGARTMLDIALSAGFNSESAFYKQFRAQAGLTPRQFQLKN